MTLNVLTAIIIITSLVSIRAFNNRAIVDKYIYNPYDIKHYGNKVRIFGHILLHANWTHLLFNMMSLYFIGNFLLGEFVYEFGNIQGQAHFLTLYILGAMFATVIPYIRNQDNPMYRSLGASGAVSAVIFAFIIWNPQQELGILFIPFRIPAYIFGPLYLLMEFFMDKRGGTGIAHDAHIGGALFGIVYALIINIDKGKELIDLII